MSTHNATDTQITHSLRQLGFDKRLDTGLSPDEYRKLVNELVLPVMRPKAKDVRAAVKLGLNKQLATADSFKPKFDKARQICLIKSALTLVATELDVNVTLATSDYPIVIAKMKELTGHVTARILAPILANYIFGEH